MPSDADAVRIHVLTPAEEMLYFHTCLRPPEEITVKAKPHVQTRNGKRVTISAYQYSKLAPREYRNLHDVGRLMILQGPRPAEVMQTRVEHVDLEHGMWFIQRSKSAAGKRTFRLTTEARSSSPRESLPLRHRAGSLRGRRRARTCWKLRTRTRLFSMPRDWRSCCTT